MKKQCPITANINQCPITAIKSKYDISPPLSCVAVDDLTITDVAWQAAPPQPRNCLPALPFLPTFFSTHVKHNYSTCLSQ